MPRNKPKLPPTSDKNRDMGYSELSCGLKLFRVFYLEHAELTSEHYLVVFETKLYVCHEFAENFILKNSQILSLLYHFRASDSHTVYLERRMKFGRIDMDTYTD